MTSTNVAVGAAVTLRGGSFFTGGWGHGVKADPQRIVDGVFFPDQWQWDQGPVWWDEHDGDHSRRIVVSLRAPARIDALIIQADNNDAYRISARNGHASAWQVLWNVPVSSSWGMATRPSRADNTERHPSPVPVVATELKIDGVASASDLFFSVSEVQAFGAFVQAVPVDARPDQCPNRLQLDSAEDYAVAIAGTDNLDAGTIDPASVRLDGVAPLRWTLGDVTTPYVPSTGKTRPDQCTSAGPDGRRDLKLKFAIPALVAALGPRSDGDVVVLHLAGQLEDGTPIAGEDVVVAHVRSDDEQRG